MMNKSTKLCFSKKMLIFDYSVLLILIVIMIVLSCKGYGVSELAMITATWIGQLAISSGFYYWKAKAENILKMPVIMLNELPKDMRDKADPNAIISSIIGIKD